MTQTEKIEIAVAELARRENDFSAAAKDFADKEAAYRLAKASAFLLADGTVAEREAIAAKKVWKEHQAKLAAEAVLQITTEKLRDVRQVISARQSILSAETRNFQISEKYTA